MQDNFPNFSGAPDDTIHQDKAKVDESETSISILKPESESTTATSSNKIFSGELDQKRPKYLVKTEFSNNYNYYDRYLRDRHKALTRFELRMQSECPPLGKVLQAIERHSSSGYQVHLRVEQKEKIAVPSDQLLNEQAIHYKNKYDIDITITKRNDSDDDWLPSEKNSKELESLITEKCKDLTPRIEGIIYSTSDSGHAIPIILQITNIGPTVLIMDVLGDGNSHFGYKEVVTLLTKLKIPFASAKEKRQADTSSCRTGALVTLRNALLDLKSNLTNGKSIFEYKDIVVSKGEFNDMYSIPDQWAFTDQIYRPKTTPEPDNPRRHYNPNKSSETISTSRQKQQQEMEYFYSLKGSVKSREDLDLSVCPDDVKVTKCGSDVIKIEWKETVEQNTYMLKKGFSIGHSSKTG